MLRKVFSSGICALIILACISILTISCGSDGLSRSKAAALISENQKFSEAIKGEMRFGQVYAKGMSDTENYELYAVLKSLGYIEEGQDKNPLMSNVNLTEKGKIEAANWEKGNNLWGDNYKIPLAKREVVEVTGISESKSGDNFAQATFTWHLQPIGEIGKALDTGKDSEQKFDGTATLQKFDDGWRVVGISGRGLPDSY